MVKKYAFMLVFSLIIIGFASSAFSVVPNKINKVPASTTTATIRGAINTPELTVPIHIMRGPPSLRVTGAGVARATGQNNNSLKNIEKRITIS